jgi:hypothetical protein
MDRPPTLQGVLLRNGGSFKGFITKQCLLEKLYLSNVSYNDLHFTTCPYLKRTVIKFLCEVFNNFDFVKKGKHLITESLYSSVYNCQTSFLSPMLV